VQGVNPSNSYSALSHDMQKSSTLEHLQAAGIHSSAASVPSTKRRVRHILVPAEQGSLLAQLEESLKGNNALTPANRMWIDPHLSCAHQPYDSSVSQDQRPPEIATTRQRLKEEVKGTKL